jgi:hypothetical protein
MADTLIGATVVEKAFTLSTGNGSSIRVSHDLGLQVFTV